MSNKHGREVVPCYHESTPCIFSEKELVHKGGQREAYGACIVHTVVGKRSTSWDKVMSEIKPISLSIVELGLAGGIS